MKRFLSALLLFYSCLGYAQTETSENLLTATEKSNNVNFNATAGTYRYSYQTGQVTAVGVLPQYDPLQILTLNWSFDALYNCNNSIGGYCADPNGIEDVIEAFLAVGNLAGDTDVREVFSREDFNQEWQTFSGTEVYDFGSAYEAVSLRIEGIDNGYWAGFYGPRVRNASVVAIYTPINSNPVTAPDCTSPLNDPSCEGYEAALAAQQPVIVVEEPTPPTFADQATNAVFGDSPDDFLFLDQPDSTGRPRIMKQIEARQVYQSTKQEAEMFDKPPPQHPEVIYLNAVEDPMQTVERLPSLEEERKVELKKSEKKLRQAEPEEIIAEIAGVIKEPRPIVEQVQDVVEPEPIIVQRETAPEKVVIEARTQPVTEAIDKVIKPSVDVIGIALSLTNQQALQAQRVENVQGQEQPKQQTVVQNSVTDYWNSATRDTQVAQALAQQTQQQQSNTMTTADLAPPAQAQFENDFNDAIATGQSVGQFLSSQAPDFSRFDIDAPSIQEQQLVQKATAAIKTMSEVQVEKSMDKQLENLENTGGFTDQSIAVFLIASNPSFDQYQDVDISDREEFYRSTQAYPKNFPRVDPLGVLRLGGSKTFNKLVDIQWQR